MNRKFVEGNTVHFIGIGGASMSGLAQILRQQGHTVSGSDREESAATARLQALGIEVMVPNAAENIKPHHELIVYTDAVAPDNPEYVRAVEADIPMLGRALLLKAITRAFNRTVCVAGSHGKTTTTALLAGVAAEAGLDPTVHVGGHMENGLNNRMGQSPYFIVEACEYKNNFLHWHPHVGVILNVDIDHGDFHGGMEGMVDSFARFAQNIHPDGVLVINAETQGFERIVRGPACRIISYGVGEGTLFHPRAVVFDEGGRPSFDVCRGGVRLLRVALKLVGAHNIQNALACFATAEALGIPPETTKRALENAPGVKRRYEYKGMYNAVPIIDDYAHHPTEIRACLAATRQKHKGRVVCVFQPHLYSRTRDLLEDFANSFADADKTLLLPIFAAREVHDPNISSEVLFARMREMKLDVECFDDFATAEQRLRKILRPGDLLLTVGAGNVHLLGERLL